MVAAVAERGNAEAPRNQVGSGSAPAADTLTLTHTSWLQPDQCHDLRQHRQPLATGGGQNANGAAQLLPSFTENRFFSFLRRPIEAETSRKPQHVWEASYCRSLKRSTETKRLPVSEVWSTFNSSEVFVKAGTAGARKVYRPLQATLDTPARRPRGCWSSSSPWLKLMLIVIGVIGYQAPSMLALPSLREISPQKDGHRCHGYVQTADVDGVMLSGVFPKTLQPSFQGRENSMSVLGYKLFKSYYSKNLNQLHEVWVKLV